MDTRSQIIKLGDDLIRKRGYNAFSFSDISKHLQIKNASVHYHFATKTSLGVAVIQEHQRRLEMLKQKTATKSPLEKLNGFLGIYSAAKAESKICLVGSLATDIHTVEPEIQAELKNLTHAILEWVTDILEEGRENGVFHFKSNGRTKALMLITNMLAAVQLTRLTGKEDFQIIKEEVVNDLIQLR